MDDVNKLTWVSNKSNLQPVMAGLHVPMCLRQLTGDQHKLNMWKSPAIYTVRPTDL